MHASTYRTANATMNDETLGLSDGLVFSAVLMLAFVATVVVLALLLFLRAT